MFNINCDKFYPIMRAVECNKMHSVNVSTYLDKGSTPLTKDRVAASFISDKALNSDILFENTVITVINDTNGSKMLYKSDKRLSYDALISLIYELRINRQLVESMANISIGQDYNMISVEEIHTDTDIIRISTSDKLKGLIKTLIREHEFRHKERHVSRIVKLYSIEDESCIHKIVTEAFKKSFNEIEVFNIRSENGDNYIILEGTNIVCIVHDENIVFVSTKQGIKLDDFIENLEFVCGKYNKEYGIEITNEIIMF